MTITDFLVWLAGGGSALALAFILEYIPSFATLTATLKKWVFFGGCALISIAAYAVQTYVPVETINAIAPYFGILASTFTYVFLGDGFHKLTKQ